MSRLLFSLVPFLFSSASFSHCFSSAPFLFPLCPLFYVSRHLSLMSLLHSSSLRFLFSKTSFSSHHFSHFPFLCHFTSLHFFVPSFIFFIFHYLFYVTSFTRHLSYFPLFYITHHSLAIFHFSPLSFPASAFSPLSAVFPLFYTFSCPAFLLRHLAKRRRGLRSGWCVIAAGNGVYRCRNGC